MPVQFTCQHCASSLSVSSRKAGERVTCPKCRHTTLVPVREVSSVLAAEIMSTSPTAMLPAEPIASETAAPEAPPVTPVASSSVAEPAPSEPSTNVAPPPTPIAPPEPPPPATAATLHEIPLTTKPTSPPEMINIPLWDANDDEVTWVYEDDRPAIHTDPTQLAVDFDKLALPRYVLYGQGALLGVVACVALVLGILIGRSSAPSAGQVRGPAKPCYITGKITYTSSSGTKLPDAGAVVLVVPQDQRPDQKAAIEGLRPDDPVPTEDLPALGQLKAIGADYTRASEQGTFKLRVPDTGEYFLLVVSRNAARRGGDKLDSIHLAQLGRYFLPAPDLIGDRRYRWQAETIQRDRDYSLVLE